MTDTSWDNSGAPAPRKGMSTWAKFGIGCGTVMLLLLGTCVAGGYFVYRRGTNAIDQAWIELRAKASSLQTVDGTRNLYRANPGLAQHYATEEEFLEAVQEWRAKMVDIPVERPSLKTLFHEKRGMEMQANRVNGHDTIHVKYPYPNGASLLMDTEDGKLVDLRVE